MGDQSLAVPTSVVSGYITKQGSQFPYSWRRRYAAFSPAEKRVAYYETEAQFKGGAPAKGSITLKGLRSDGESLGLVFELEEGNREMKARVSNADELARWVAVSESVKSANESAKESAAAGAA